LFILYSGVGFGICHRLLIQLARAVPPDTLPQAFSDGLEPAEATAEYIPCTALTLILACRKRADGEATRTRLLELVNLDLQRQRNDSAYDGNAEIFRENLQIDIATMELSDANSVLHFCDELNHKLVPC
jgi:3-keto steroid reductase